MLSQVVCRLLTLKFHLLGLESSATCQYGILDLARDSRSSIGIEQDMAILQVLSLRPVLEMLLERVAAIDRGDGSLVDLDV